MSREARPDKKKNIQWNLRWIHFLCRRLYLPFRHSKFILIYMNRKKMNKTFFGIYYKNQTFELLISHSRFQTSSTVPRQLQLAYCLRIFNYRETAVFYFLAWFFKNRMSTLNFMSVLKLASLSVHRNGSCCFLRKAVFSRFYIFFIGFTGTLCWHWEDVVYCWKSIKFAMICKTCR